MCGRFSPIEGTGASSGGRSPPCWPTSRLCRVPSPNEQKGVGMKLVSSSAIVTGAGQGIGLAIAAHLMRNGANVLLFGRTREKVEAAAEELNRTMEGRVRAVPFTGDVVRAADVSRAIETATREFGLPGILVNNAGT